MQIELKEITIAELSKGYINSNEDGVTGYDGRLNIRPKYQREFIYKDKQREAVIDTVRKDFPLNVMYWVKNKDNTYEVLDGQQRTISICEYVGGKFSIGYQYFHNLEDEEKEQILSYKIMVYFCEGTNRDKLDWFKTINIAGEKLNNQELRNAIYTGEWLTDAKKYFSKSGCPAYNIGSKLLKGASIRQDYLETVIKWISDDNVEQYMADNQRNINATDLWLYFQNVINWVNVTFPNYRKEMKGIAFGALYNKYNASTLNATAIESEISELMRDEDVTKKSGVYYYVLTRDEKHINIRAFSNNQKRETYEKQDGVCVTCGNKFEIAEMEADHIDPWCSGGKTTLENCQMLCKHCNRVKSST